MAFSCRFHCAICDRHFGSLLAFDRHRRGSFDDRECVEPSDNPTRFRQSSDGQCRISGRGTIRGVTVWAVPMTPAARERLRRLSERGR